jgi:hypothetical protein
VIAAVAPWRTTKQSELRYDTAVANSPRMESNMAKEVQQKKQEKKKPAKTLMEKRAQKQAKKAEKGR